MSVYPSEAKQGPTQVGPVAGSEEGNPQSVPEGLRMDIGAYAQVEETQEVKPDTQF